MEAMALFKKINADYLLSDDKQARKITSYNGIKIIGSIGVLIWSKNCKLIKDSFAVKGGIIFIN